MLQINLKYIGLASFVIVAGLIWNCFWFLTDLFRDLNILNKEIYFVLALSIITIPYIIWVFNVFFEYETKVYQNNR